MFAIGDKKWPGLSKLIEECGEVVQVGGKLLGTGGRLAHWDGSNLKDRLEEELADLLAAIRFFIERNGLDTKAVFRRAEAKLQTFRKWDQGDHGPSRSTH